MTTRTTARATTREQRRQLEQMLATWRTDGMACIESFTIPAARGVDQFCNVMAPFQRERLSPLLVDLQAVAVGKQPARGRHWWEGTKGSSKDSDLAAAIVWLLWASQRSLDIQIGAADRDQAGELRKAAKLLLSHNPWLSKSGIEVQSWTIVNTNTDSRAEIIAADVAGSHGARPDVLILNELTHIEGQGQTFAENLMDNAAKVPHGVVVIATNAGFPDSWQYRWRETARTSDRWFFHRWEEPAPWLNERDIEEARKRNGRSRFLRLFFGQWLSAAENPLLTWNMIAACQDEDCLWPGGIFPIRNSYRPELYVGVDIGRTKDRTVIWTLELVKDVAITRSVKVLHGVPFGEQKREIKSCINRHVVRLLIDKGGIGMQLAEELEHEHPRVVEGVQLTAGKQGQIATLVKTKFEGQSIRVPKDEVIEADLQLIEETETVSGLPRITTNRGPTGHGDRFWAMALALSGLPVDGRQKRGGGLPRGRRAMGIGSGPTRADLYSGW